MRQKRSNVLPRTQIQGITDLWRMIHPVGKETNIIDSFLFVDSPLARDNST